MHPTRLLENRSIRCFVDALKNLAPEAWEGVVAREPEYGFLSHALAHYRWEEALALTVIAGLNDYQLRCRAEYCYWPPLEAILREAGGDYKSALEGMIQFYQSQPLGGQKAARVRRFLGSELYGEIMMHRWPPGVLEERLGEFWARLGYAMGQPPTAKTIAFAAKLVAMLLTIAGYRSYGAARLPIPVDRRVEKLTHCLTGTSLDPDSTRELWSQVLGELRTRFPSLTMVELDSLLWQLAAQLDREGVVDYFAGLGSPGVGRRIAECLGGCKE